MAESLKNDEKTIRSYILNDVVEKVPIDKSYMNLCKVIGNDAIAFYDFQYWYYRFLGGNQDLDFDRSRLSRPLAGKLYFCSQKTAQRIEVRKQRRKGSFEETAAERRFNGAKSFRDRPKNLR
ncbi:hypothetical protein CAEBREN_22946 [Caenorhabditis brenneri]|uniref:Mos1 transposase HTH domain-containing protein n=1 Tax=Caenorhabditis brenneri TaxID=135651 RepID=G0N309_CAEBE|nr:hypothetical protein CAEBREN_22946 [Caenorhabditis brenneri]